MIVFEEHIGKTVWDVSPNFGRIGTWKILAIDEHNRDLVKIMLVEKARETAIKIGEIIWVNEKDLTQTDEAVINSLMKRMGYDNNT